MITLRAIAAVVIDGHLNFRAGQLLHDFVDEVASLPGIGYWMANYVAMRALNHPDAFPASDPVLQQMLGANKRLSEREMEIHSQAWRPWRAYAVWHLWHSYEMKHLKFKI